MRSLSTPTILVLTSILSAVLGFNVQSSSSLTRTALFSTSSSSSSSALGSSSSEKTPAPSSQPEYGKTKELPGTYVRCGRCATSYAIAATDLGTGKGRRIECSLCGHSWFQTPDRLFTLNDGHELKPLPQSEIDRINSNIKNNRDADFTGHAKFYVGNLDFGVVEDDLRKLFADVGEVGSVHIVSGPDGRSKGFAFVTMMDDDVADACMKLDGFELSGRNINVKPPNN